MLPPRAQSRLEAFIPCERNHLTAFSPSTVSFRPDSTNPDRAPRDTFLHLRCGGALATRGAGVDYERQKSANWVVSRLPQSARWHPMYLKIAANKIVAPSLSIQNPIPLKFRAPRDD
jgi:hypothetical protein